MIINKRPTVPPARLTAWLVDSGRCGDRIILIIVVQIGVAIWIRTRVRSRFVVVLFSIIVDTRRSKQSGLAEDAHITIEFARRSRVALVASPAEKEESNKC